jgi:tetratricopeptide (TPR) repeat protein
MIVRNESAVLGRCIGSVIDLIDSWVICDTGSTDDTPEILQSLLGHLPGQLHRRPWVNFGHNRTELFTLANGAADYLLLLDADHTVERRAEIGPLTADEYMVRQREGVEHWLPRLVRGGLPWRFVGATHEYLACDLPTRRERLDGLVVVHHGDGGARADKLERDRRLLEEELQRNPDDQRSHFYLGQTMEGLGDIDAAIAYYDRRVALGGWDEEVFIAGFRSADLVARHDLDAGIGALFEAWERRPHRFEPLYSLARLANQAERNHLALLATGPWQEPRMPGDLLFVDPVAHSWGLAFERSIALARVGRVAEAIDIGDRILLEMNPPDHLQVDLLANRQICVDFMIERGEEPPNVRPVPFLADLVDDDAQVIDLEIDLDPQWNPMNPSIAVDQDAPAIIVRTVNYERRDDGAYAIHDPDDVVRTRNFLLRHDVDGRRSACEELVEPALPERVPTGVRGLEDARLFRWRGEWHILATARDLTPTWRCQMALGRLDGPDIVDLTPLPFPVEGRDEKNWMPFVHDGRLRFVYSCHPLVILEWDPDASSLREVVRHETPSHLESLRGGAQGTWIDGNLLLIGHHVRHSGGRRLYQHRFLMLDRELRPSSCSPLFSFERYGVEFCAGMARRDEDLLLSYGVNDGAARLMAVSLDAVLGVMEPLVAG